MSKSLKGLILTVILLISISCFPRVKKPPNILSGESYNSSKFYVKYSGIKEIKDPIISGNFLKGNYPPYTIDTHVLGSLSGVDRIIKRENLTSIPELNRIIWYESTNNPKAKNPESSAYGYCQMIDSTREWVIKDLEEDGISIDYEDPDNQLIACKYLYKNSNPEKEWKETYHLWSVDN